MNRRQFLQSAALGAPCLALETWAPPTDITLTLDPTRPSHLIPTNFTGLSYESAQLANPAFFSARNQQLIALFRELSLSGVLRIGGGSSEFTTYSADDPTTPPPFELFGPDTSHTVKQGTITSALALHNLRAFLDATGWSCLYGLNLGQGTVANAVAEALAAAQILGPRLLALQIGNEPDSFRNRYRPASYAPAEFMAEWNIFHAAIVDRLRAAGLTARFAGPDISNKLTFLTAFADEASRHPDLVFLSGHYYAMGPAGNPDATLANMLLPDPKLTTLKQRDIPIVLDAARTAGLPFRVSEINSCWNGGQAGASDTFASALWCADTMLRFAALGFSGVNLHGGGNGIYSPIVGSASTGFTRRPEFFGIQFAQHFAGSTLLPTLLETSDPRITAYVFEHNGKQQVALINKTPTAWRCHLPGIARPAFELTAPSIDSTSGVQLRKALTHDQRNTVMLAPYSARIDNLQPFRARPGAKP